jgi:hypothetical protein
MTRCCSMLTRKATALASLVTIAAACLPDDTRPEPGRLRMTVTADETIASGVTTADGWTITFDRFWLSLGEVRLEGDDCSPYAEGDYLRILDLRVPGAQTLNTSYALGDCELGFQLRAPRDDAVLGSGIDAEIETFMRKPATDAFVTDASGVVLHVAGSATKSEKIFEFAWSFRQRLDYLCGVITFRSGESHTLDVEIRGAALFIERTDDERADLRFDPHAAADRDGDGAITLEELEAMPLGDENDRETLGTRVYLGLVPQLANLRGQDQCFVAPLAEE